MYPAFTENLYQVIKDNPGMFMKKEEE